VLGPTTLNNIDIRSPLAKQTENGRCITDNGFSGSIVMNWPGLNFRRSSPGERSTENIPDPSAVSSHFNTVALIFISFLNEHSSYGFIEILDDKILFVKLKTRRVLAGFIFISA